MIRKSRDERLTQLAGRALEGLPGGAPTTTDVRLVVGLLAEQPAAQRKLARRLARTSPARAGVDDEQAAALLGQARARAMVVTAEDEASRVAEAMRQYLRGS